jgi:hypothetical protein
VPLPYAQGHTPIETHDTDWTAGFSRQHEMAEDNEELDEAVLISRLRMLIAPWRVDRLYGALFVYKQAYLLSHESTNPIATNSMNMRSKFEGEKRYALSKMIPHDNR